MDYEKKYNYVLKRAEELKKYSSSPQIKAWVDNVFPELQDKNEKIIRAIIAHIRGSRYYDISYGVTPPEMVAWLEKQSEQKPTWSEEDEKIMNEIFSVAARASLRKSTLFGKSYDYIKWQNWLKSLRPQNMWKPSKEQ